MTNGLKVRWGCTLLLGLAFTSLAMAEPKESMTLDAIDARTKPIGEVQIQQAQPTAQLTASSSTPATNQQPANQAAATTTPASGNKPARDGKTIYEAHCVICHEAGVAGSPKFENKGDWAPRMKKGKDALLKSVVNGLNAMPPMGTCQDCTEEELQKAIDYMMPK